MSPKLLLSLPLPLYSLPNNCRKNDPNLFGDKNRGEGVSEDIRKNTHGKFGIKNSDGKEAEIISGMLAELFPRNYKISTSSEWDQCKKPINRRRLYQKSRQLELFSKVIASNNLPHALEMLILFIERHPVLHNLLCSKLDTLHRTLAYYLKRFVCHLAHSGTRSSDEKDALHTIISACRRDIPEADENRVREILGVSRKVWYDKTNSPNEERYQHKTRKERDVSELVRRQCRSIVQFFHSKEASHIDSNSQRIVDVINEEGEEEKNVGRVWGFPTIREQYEVYKNSDVVTHFIAAGNFSIVGITTFFKLRCPCVICASMQSCVDERISATFHYVRAIKKFIQYKKPIQDKLKDSETYPFM